MSQDPPITIEYKQSLIFAGAGGWHKGCTGEVVLAHFAKRKGVTLYRPTAHDEKKLALLQEAGYGRKEILSAIDLAFDTHPEDAEPIRMFSYCATIALATPHRHLSTFESEQDSAAQFSLPARVAHGDHHQQGAGSAAQSSTWALISRTSSMVR